MNTIDELNLSLTNHTPGPDAIAQIERIRDAAKALGTAILRECPPSRERSVALTEMETAVMWAVKSVALPRQESLL